MANYKLTTEIAKIVYDLLSSITKSKYLISRPSLTSDSEYFVVNSLPSYADVMQNVLVNVNCFVKDIDGGDGVGFIPDYTKLNANALSILNILEKVSSTSYLIDFESQSIEQEEDYHFINLRFSFKYINN